MTSAPEFAFSDRHARPRQIPRLPRSGPCSGSPSRAVRLAELLTTSLATALLLVALVEAVRPITAHVPQLARRATAACQRPAGNSHSGIGGPRVPPHS